MSHVSIVDPQDIGAVITSIKHLQRAIQLISPDLEMVKGKHYRTWKDDHGGKLVGDWSLPEGMTAEEVGNNAEYVIRLTDAALRGRPRGHNGPYEVGVVPHPTKKGQYLLVADFWASGNGLFKAKGLERIAVKGRGKSVEGFAKLYMGYQIATQEAVAKRKGQKLQLPMNADGTVKLEADGSVLGTIDVEVDLG
jgi:hypothetical protein